MNKGLPLYLEILNNEFDKKKRINKHYSLRAYAKKLEIDSSNLSAILKNKRPLPQRRIHTFVKKLNLTKTEGELFRLSAQREATQIDKIRLSKIKKKYLVEKKYNNIIRKNIYYAFLQLIKTNDFNPNHDNICAKLNSTKSELEQVINELTELHFIKKCSKRGYKRVVSSLESSEDVPNSLIKESHKESMLEALKKIDIIDIDKRDYSSVTMAIDPLKINQAKAIIREFQDKLTSLLTSSENITEVYQFNCQLYPYSNE